MQQQRQQTGGRAKATLFLLGALVVAGITSYLVWRVVDNMQAELARAQEGPEKIRVLRANRDIFMGEAITEADVGVVAVVPDTVYPDLVFKEDQIQQLLNRTAKERILAGEILREERLADADAGIGLNALIPRGMRAMAIDVDPESSLGGLLQPGNRVDVIVTIRPDDRQSETKWVTETILQDKRILAVGDRLKPIGGSDEPEDESKRNAKRRTRPTVTLELTLEESEKLALASSRGDLHLVLRSDVDNLQEETGGPLNTATLMGLQPTAPVSTGRGRRSAPATNPNLVTAEVIEGGSTTSVQFDAQGNRVDGKAPRRR